MAELIETWEVYGELHSLRRTARKVHISKGAVEKRLKKFRRMRDSGEVEFVDGRWRSVKK